jgi:hypothetical protein
VTLASQLGLLATRVGNEVRNRSGHPGFVAGRHYPLPVVSAPVAVAVAANIIRLVPVWIPLPATIAELGVRVTVAVAATNCQAALYNTHATTRRPTTLVGATGNLSSAAVAAVSGALAGGNKAVVPGWYWLGVNSSGAPTLVGKAVTDYDVAWAMGSATQGSVIGTTGALMGLTTPATFGTWGDLTAAAFTEVVTALPVGTMKVA